MLRHQCMICHRYYDTDEEIDGDLNISHDLCARCSFCDPEQRDMLYGEGPVRPQDVMREIKDEKNRNVVWQGEDTKAGTFEPSLEKIFVRLEQRVVSEIQREKENMPGGRR